MPIWRTVLIQVHGVSSCEPRHDFHTEDHRSSRVFSLFLGLLFTGMSIGPTLGSLLISYTGHALSVFYIAAFVHLLYSLGIWFIIPESLSAAQMADSAKLHEERLEQLRHSRSKGGVLVWLSRIFGFLTPLALLFPAAAEGGSPMKKKRRDGSLLLLATGYGFAISLMVSAPRYCHLKSVS